MLKKILIGLLGLIAVVLVVAALQPNEFKVERSIAINAPATAVFAQINDFHNWNAWSPWAKIDPNMTVTYSGPTSGVGAHYEWTGNKKVGQGAMTIESSKSNESIQIKLEFLKPFKATNHCQFTFTEKDGQTQLTWTMIGQNNFIAKLMHLFMNMDKMVGSDFEKGLAQIKAVSETSPR